MNTINNTSNKNIYVLITAARNEENHIENTIRSIITQTILPVSWIIVSDGSTDRTDEIVKRYSELYHFIHLVQKAANISEQVDFSSKVFAVQAGYEKLCHLDFDFIGILDGDVTFDSSYYENILNKFSEKPGMGIAGGIILDQYDDHHIRRSPQNLNYVSGCIQLFRRQCYEDIGGLSPVREGGEDTIAAITARMKGWKVETFEEFKVFHHKHSEVARGLLKEIFREGRMFYVLGSHPLFEIIKSVRRIIERPYLVNAFVRLIGYFWPYCTGLKRPVSAEFIKFLRREQFAQLKAVFIQKAKLHYP